MSFEADEEILQDFLIEAGEILEQLSEELVQLEQNSDDMNLLNAIFRGFHTVKGGAGFLQLDALVDCCHVAENVFDLLRNGKIAVTAELMDVVLQALDSVNEMFLQVNNREEVTPATPALLQALEALTVPGGAAPVVEAVAPETPAEPVVEAPQKTAAAESGDFSDTEFEQLLGALDEGAADAGTGTPSDSDEITEDEFDALLDQLHGSGAVPGAGKTEPKASAPATPDSGATAGSTTDNGTSNGEITDDEFDDLLDQLHGKGKFGAVAGESTPAAEPTPASTGASAPSSEPITDDEFESLLDDLHGAGKGPTAVTPAAAKPAPAPVPPKVEPVAAKPAAKPATPAAAPKKAAGQPNVAAPTAEATVRVDTRRLDDIMNMVGELVLVRNRLVRLGLQSDNEEMSKAVGNLDVVTADLQTSVMKTRMQPIKKVFGRFPRVVRDLARNLKKEINLELVGEETDLDKNLVEALADPLVHLVRNSVDHGVENPADREAAGKTRTGKIILAAAQEGDHILLTITDDGGGMNPEKLKEIAVSKGVIDADAAERLSDKEAFNLIFMPGFSTKAEASDISGRGVGMDVVKTKITQLNGTVDIDSTMGTGTRIAIKVPLTLAIMPTLMVMLGDQAFALPLVSVNEIFNLDLSRTNVVDGQEVVTVRDKALPLFYLKRWLIGDFVDESSSKSGHVVIVNVGTQQMGFVVDQLVGQEEVVIKPLGKMLHGTPGMAGATITGDGRIALILDIPSLLKHYATRM